MRDKIKIGDMFIAIVREGLHSKTLAGEEKAGASIGKFKATKIAKNTIESEVRIFDFEDWVIRKVYE